MESDGTTRVIAHILVVEDDPALSDIVCTYLGEHSYACTAAFSGSEARLLLGAGQPDFKQPFDLVITDLMLPGAPGEKVVELVRSRSAAPVIVTSARTAVADRVTLLRIGADDYLSKPFDLEELLARVEACLRRQGAGNGSANGSDPARPVPDGNTPTTLRFGLWEANEGARTFSVGGEPLKLTRTEFDLLCALMRHPHRAFSKRELFELMGRGEALGDPSDEKTVATHMGDIRAKLKPTGTQEYIQTVWGIGFKLAEL